MEQLKQPSAPKDPVQKRPAVYLMFESLVEARPNGQGGYQDVNYLDGRVEAKVTSVLPELDKNLAKKLQVCSSFRQLVHSIGVSASAVNAEDRNDVMQFSLNCNCQNGYEGTSFHTDVLLNGRESIVALEAYPCSEQDTVLSSVLMKFPRYMTAKITVVFYLQYGIPVPELTVDEPVNFESEAYQRMIQRSLLHEGNLSRVTRTIEKAKRGDEVTIAFIGGSITQGAAAKPIGTASYAYLTYSFIKQCFAPGDGRNVHFVKAGVGGTSSEFGVARYERDLLRNGTVKPDLVIIEYAVNDLGDETEGICYESLIRKAMKGPGEPGVILLFSVFMDDWNLQERLAPIGYHYDLPMVSIKDAVVPQFYEETPVITKRQYFYDLFHPTNEGHRIMADCIRNLLMLASECISEDDCLNNDCQLKPHPLLGNTWQDLQTITRKTCQNCNNVMALECGMFCESDNVLQCVELDDHAYTTPEFEDNWMYAGMMPAEKDEFVVESDQAACAEEVPVRNTFCLTIRCQNLMILYKDSGDPSFGPADIFVDGQKARTIDPLEVGWNHCNAAIIVQSDQDAIHQVEVQMVDPMKCFTILGFCYV